MDDHEALVAAVDYILTSGHAPDKHKTLKTELADWLKVQQEHANPFPEQTAIGSATERWQDPGTLEDAAKEKEK
jgi:hypothetical protein